MNTVTIKPLEHKGTQVIGIYFEKDIKLNIVLQKAVAAKWSKTNKCWYMDCTKETCNKLRIAVKGIAELDGKAMQDYFKQNTQNPVKTHINASKNNASNAQGDFNTNYNPSQQVEANNKTVKKTTPTIRICDANAEALAKFNQTLVLKGYSPVSYTHLTLPTNREV